MRCRATFAYPAAATDLSRCQTCQSYPHTRRQAVPDRFRYNQAVSTWLERYRTTRYTWLRCPRTIWETRPHNASDRYLWPGGNTPDATHWERTSRNTSERY